MIWWSFLTLRTCQITLISQALTYILDLTGNPVNLTNDIDKTNTLASPCGISYCVLEFEENPQKIFYLGY